jgi:hypothetical protein
MVIVEGEVPTGGRGLGEAFSRKRQPNIKSSCTSQARFSAGDHPDSRRDRDVTPDLELEYLYHQLVERGHARQLLSLDGGHLYELTVARIMVEGDDAVYCYVSGTLRADHFPT